MNKINFYRGQIVLQRGGQGNGLLGKDRELRFGQEKIKMPNELPMENFKKIV